MPAPQRSLTDTVIAVTGAGGGIGSSICALALEAGAQVVACDLRQEALDALHERLDASFGEVGRVAYVAGDTSDPATSRAIVEAAVGAFGRLDSVVANAAVGFYGGVMDQSEEQIRTMVNVNVLGTVWLTRAAVQQFRAQARAGGDAHVDAQEQGGDIVILGSVAGLQIGGGMEAVYSATKGAQVNLASGLDRELRSEGIRTTVIAPAGVNTPFAAADGRFGDGAPEDGHFMEPADIAGAVLYTLQQPRRMRTDLWTMWSLAEQR